MKTNGQLIVFSGPSGSGKDTILKSLLAQNENIKLSISATTRPSRPSEVNGKDYYFISRDEFLSMVARNEMLESAEYCGNFYGTPKAPIESWILEGKSVILKIEVQGGAQIKEKCPDCISIFILPPSLEELEHRLRCRATENEESILKRVEAARREILEAKKYDYVVVNDTVESAVEQINQIICAEKHRTNRDHNLIERVLNQHAETI